MNKIHQSKNNCKNKQRHHQTINKPNKSLLISQHLVGGSKTYCTTFTWKTCNLSLIAEIWVNWRNLCQNSNLRVLHHWVLSPQFPFFWSNIASKPLIVFIIPHSVHVTSVHVNNKMTMSMHYSCTCYLIFLAQELTHHQLCIHSFPHAQGTFGSCKDTM